MGSGYGAGVEGACRPPSAAQGGAAAPQRRASHRSAQPSGAARPGETEHGGSERAEASRRRPGPFGSFAAAEASLPALLILAVCMGWLYAQEVSRQAFVVSAALWAVSAFAYVAAPRVVGFVIMVGEVLASGVALVAIAWLRHEPSAPQWHWVAVHGLFVGVNWLMWVAVLVLKDVRAATGEMAAELALLRKTTGATGVLTRSEFLYEAQWLLTAMARRDEAGFLLNVVVPDGPAAPATVHSVGRTLAEAVRRNFDLVGQVAPTTLAVLLQRTDDVGVHVVQERFRANLLAICTPEFCERLRVTVSELPPGASIARALAPEQPGAAPTWPS